MDRYRTIKRQNARTGRHIEAGMLETCCLASAWASAPGYTDPIYSPQPLGHPSILMLVEEPQRKTNRVN